MALELELESLDGVDESLKGLYEEKEGVYRLAVSGLDDAIAGKTTLLRVKEERNEAKAKLAEIAAEKQRIEDERKAAEHESLIKNGQAQELYELSKKEIEESKHKYEQLLSAIEQEKIEAVSMKIGTIGLDGFQEFLTHQASKYMRCEKGKLFFEIGGVEVDQKEVEKLISDKFPDLVKGSGAGGAGSTGNNSKGGALQTNPFRKGENFNLSEQGRIMRENPTLANQLRSEAQNG